MALTPGFKKFAGLILVTALVGGGIFAFKSGAFKSSTPPAAQVEAQVNQQAEDSGMTIPQPINSPIAQAERVEQVVEQVAAPAEQEQPAPQAGASNSGMDALLNSGKK